MDNFIYSLNATVPVFFVITVGYLLKRLGMFNEAFIKVADKFTFTVALPIMLMRDVGAMRIMDVFNIRLFVFGVVATTLCFFGIWLLAEHTLKEKNMIGSFVQGSFRGSVAVLGVAFMQNIYGNVGLAPLIIISTVPLYNIFSVIVLTLKAENFSASGGRVIKNAAVNIVKNPLIIGIALGVLWSLTNVSMPFIVDKTLANFSVMATPLALLTIGASFNGEKALAKLKVASTASFLKLVAQPAIFLPLGVFWGFRGQALIALLIMMGTSTTPSTYIMAKNMGNDAHLSSSIVILSTLFSSVTLTGWIFLLKSLELL